VHFLNSVLASRPYIQQDLDLMIRFNNLLTQLRLSEIDSVATAAEKIDNQLRKNKNLAALNDAEEKTKL